MALIDVRCTTCQTVSEVYRAAADHPKTPPCPKCDAATEQVHLPSGFRTLPPAVVLYKAPDGSFRFPGTDDPYSRSAQNYEKLGYTRVEARGWAEVRRVEGQVNTHQAREIRQRIERQCEIHESSVKARRSDVYNGLANSFAIPELDSRGRHTGRLKAVKLSPAGREIMREAMAKNDRKPGPRSFEPGFHVSAYSNSRSNT